MVVVGRVVGTYSLTAFDKYTGATARAAALYVAFSFYNYRGGDS